MPRRIHPLIVENEHDGYVDTANWPADGAIELKQDDETLTQTLLSSATVGSRDMLFATCVEKPGMRHLKHHHPHGSEIYYITKGKCILYLGDEELTVTPGMAIYIPPNCVHGTHNPFDEDCELVCVCSTPEYAALGIVYDE